VRLFPDTIAAALLLSASPVAASDFNWRDPANQHRAIGALHNFAGFCSSMGFAEVPLLPEETLKQKWEAYLLLSSSPDAVLIGWARMVSDWTQLEKAANDPTLVNRAADALEAAARDPESYDEAEALYIRTGMGPVKRAFAACERGAADPFVGKYFLTGHGSLEGTEAKAKESFADGVREVKADLSKKSAK
jgi:hypothetical protein